MTRGPWGSIMASESESSSVQVDHESSEESSGPEKLKASDSPLGSDPDSPIGSDSDSPTGSRIPEFMPNEVLGEVGDCRYELACGDGGESGGDISKAGFSILKF